MERKPRTYVVFLGILQVGEAGIEPATFAAQVRRATTALLPDMFNIVKDLKEKELQALKAYMLSVN